MDDELRTEKIEQYLDDQLKGEELKQFEQQIREDETLAKEVAKVRDLNEAFEDAPFEKAFEEQWQSIKRQNQNNEENQKNTSTKSNKKLVVSLLLLIGVLIGSFLVWKSVTKPVASEMIFASYYEPYASDQATRSEMTIEENYEKAIAYYDNGEHAKAIPLLQNHITQFPTEISPKILLGNSYLATKSAQTTEAITLFQTLLTDSNIGLKEESTQWYLALAFLKNDDKPAAKDLLETLAAKERGKYPKLAQQLLLEL